jgi:carboxymethylenebutenolidase
MAEQGHFTTLHVSDGGTMRAYVARPATTELRAGMLVFPDAFGLHHHNLAIVDEWARRGFVAIAPELFHRSVEGAPGEYGDLAAVMPHIRALTAEGLVADATAAFEWLATEGGADRSRIAAVGFCMGGRTAFLANSALPLVASISYYGGSIAPGLLDRAAALHGPQLFFWGGQDRGIPPEQHRAVADAVRAAGKRFVDVEFSWANHGFATEHNPEPAAARQASALAMAFVRDALDGAMPV